MVNNSGKFRSKQALEEIYAMNGVPLGGDEIDFCNSGHYGALGWFVTSDLLGNKKARMYDGSMIEWTADPSLPLERKVVVKA